MKPGEVLARKFLRYVMVFESISGPIETLGGWRRTESALPQGKLCHPTEAAMSLTGTGAGMSGVGSWHRLVVHRGHTFIGVVCVFRMCKLDLTIWKIQIVEHLGRQLVWTFKGVTFSVTKRHGNWEQCVVLGSGLEKKKKWQAKRTRLVNWGHLKMDRMLDNGVGFGYVFPGWDEGGSSRRMPLFWGRPYWRGQGWSVATSGRNSQTVLRAHKRSQRDAEAASGWRGSQTEATWVFLLLFLQLFGRFQHFQNEEEEN